MLKNVSNQWKAEIIDAVGINEFTDMYIQAIREFIREDLCEIEIKQIDFDEMLTDEDLDGMISKIMHLVFEKEEDLKPLTISTKVIVARAILNDVDFYEIDFSKKIDHEALMEQIKRNRADRFQMAKDLGDAFFEKENIVKATCKELGITYRELGEAIGYGGDSLRNIASKVEVSEPLTKAIELYKENLALKAQLQDCNTLKQALKNLIK